MLFVLTVLIVGIFYTMRKMNVSDKNDNVRYVSEYDKCESPIERMLYLALVNNDYSPYTQYKIGKYRCDMAFPSYKLIIECDGKDYHSSKSQKNRDGIRDKYLKECGYTAIRFTGRQIYKNRKGCVRKIERHLQMNKE